MTEPPQGNFKISKALVIGAGFAGTHMVRELSSYCEQIIWVDEHELPGQGASGNPIGIVMPQLVDVTNPVAVWNHLAFREALRIYGNSPHWRASGVVQWAEDSNEFEKLERKAAPWADSVHAIQMGSRNGFLNAEAGILQPQAWIRAEWERLRIQLKDRLQWMGSTRLKHLEIIPAGTGWTAVLEKKSTSRTPDQSSVEVKIHANLVILCHSLGLRQLDQTKWLSLRPARGQLVVARETESSRKVIHAQIGKTYITPSWAGEHVVGATFDVGSEELESRPEQTVELLKDYQDFWSIDDAVRTRVSIRSVTTDHLPIVGPVPDFDKTCALWSRHRFGEPIGPISNAPTLDGLFVLSGLGAKGISGSVLAAQVVSEAILKGQAKVSENVRDSVHPARFVARALRRNQI